MEKRTQFKYSPRWGVFVNGQLMKKHRFLRNAQMTAKVRKADLFKPNDKVEILDLKTKQFMQID